MKFKVEYSQTVYYSDEIELDAIDVTEILGEYAVATGASVDDLVRIINDPNEFSEIAQQTEWFNSVVSEELTFKEKDARNFDYERFVVIKK